MSCRCGEIRECGRDLRKLDQTKGRVQVILRTGEEVRSRLGAIASYCESAFLSTRAPEIREKLTSLTEKACALTREEGERMDRAEGDVGRRRQRFEREDERYHEAEDDD